MNRRDFLRRFPAMVSAVASAAVAPAVLLRAATAGAANRAAVVAAASDLKYALDAVAERYAAQGNPKPKLIFGSSGNFTRQIQQGAPFDLFLSADESYIAQLVASGLTRDAGVVYAVGRIGIAVPPGSPVQADRDLAGLRRALAAGKVNRFAIANPEHAPYGKRAQEALQYAGLWEAIQPYLVLGENIAQAMQFALSGGAQGGIIALSLAKAPPVAPRLGGFALIPEAWHTPLVQRMALLRAAHPEAERFYAYLQGNDARAILAQYGFVLP